MHHHGHHHDCPPPVGGSGRVFGPTASADVDASFGSNRSDFYLDLMAACDEEQADINQEQQSLDQIRAYIEANVP